MKSLAGRIHKAEITTSLLPLAGYIRTGMKVQSQSGAMIPKSLDYFKATGDYAHVFHEAFGKEPKSITVVFLSDNLSESCYEEYDGRDKDGRRLGWGDGVNYYIWDFSSKSYIMRTREEAAELTKKLSIKWSHLLTLNFLIPRIREVFAMWRFQTKGEASSIPQIIGAFDTVKNIAGTIVNIPFDLVVKKVKSQKPGVASTFPVVNLIANLSQENIMAVRTLMDSGLDIQRAGMLSNERIISMKPKELGDGQTIYEVSK